MSRVTRGPWPADEISTRCSYRQPRSTPASSSSGPPRNPTSTQDREPPAGSPGPCRAVPPQRTRRAPARSELGAEVPRSRRPSPRARPAEYDGAAPLGENSVVISGVGIRRGAVPLPRRRTPCSSRMCASRRTGGRSARRAPAATERGLTLARQRRCASPGAQPRRVAPRCPGRQLGGASPRAVEVSQRARASPGPQAPRAGPYWRRSAQKVCSTASRNSVGSTASTGTGPSLARNSYPVSGPYLSPPAETWPLIWKRISMEGCWPAW
jgi:hypothetical protein